LILVDPFLKRRVRLERGRWNPEGCLEGVVEESKSLRKPNETEKRDRGSLLRRWMREEVEHIWKLTGETRSWMVEGICLYVEGREEVCVRVSESDSPRCRRKKE